MMNSGKYLSCPEKKKILSQYISIFALFFISYGYFFQGGGWNQNSRVCLIRAILHHGTFAIDNLREDSTDPNFVFVNTGDWSFHNGHYYSNKSPGLSLMAAPAFLISECTFKILFPLNPEKQILFSTYISTLCNTTLCAALLSVLLFHVLSHFLGISLNISALLTIFFGFGTLVFSYSTTLYAHIPAAFFSFLSFVTAMHLKHKNFKGKKTAALFSGIFCSAAVIIEPSTVIIVGCVVAYMLGSGWRYALYFMLGCIPLGIVQCAYNLICFGGPLVSSYSCSNALVMSKVNGKLFGIPHPGVVLRLLFYPYRGLFVSSPLLILALPGSLILFKKTQWFSEAFFCIAVSALFILFIGSFYAWDGGPAAGPRYLLPAFPFMFMCALYSMKLFPKTFIALGLVSIFVNLSITTVGNEIPQHIKNPLGDFVIKKITAGKVSFNPVPVSNFNNYLNKDVPSEMDAWNPNFNSFNIGELLFPNHLVSLLPLFCFWLLWIWLWRRYAR